MFKKIMIIGSSEPSCLEQSYVRAADSLNMLVQHFDPVKAEQKYIKFGRFGKKLNMFLPVYAWERKANRDLIIAVKEFRPDIILIFTNAKVQFGALATIKIISQAKVAWIWPDSPMNLMPQNLLSSRLYDISATYSEKSVPVFEELGFKNVRWVPLAGDTMLHGYNEPADQFTCDISFVGMWRPEREKVLAAIIKAFPDLKIEIYGSHWKQPGVSGEVISRLKGQSLRGQALADYYNRSRINLNIIDDTNYPAANMRLFEICTAGGLQLTTGCPEMEGRFIHKEHLLYSGNETEMINNISWVLQHPGEAESIRKAGKKLISESNSYVHRLQLILKEAANLYG